MLPEDRATARRYRQPGFRVEEAARLAFVVSLANVGVARDLRLAAAVQARAEACFALGLLRRTFRRWDDADLYPALDIARAQNCRDVCALLRNRGPRRAAAPRKEG